jgi:DNA-binding response OmpR family regulator
MAALPTRILCLGRDAALQETRCAVLAHSGYDAQSATIPDGYRQLRNGAFDLVIVSARLAEQNRDEFLSALPTETQTLVVKEFFYPKELLAAVAELLVSKPFLVKTNA